MFQFPLAGRKAALSHSSLPTSTEDQSHLTKAERLLGATGIRGAARQQLSPRPSYMSMNPSISEVGEEDYDDFSNPNHFGLDPLPLRLADLEQNASAETLETGAGRGGHYTRSIASSHGPQVKPAWSSSTLKSHYDANKLPSSITQQTSNSAVRDRALRKGMSPVYEAPDTMGRRPRTASASSTAYDSLDDMSHATALPDITRLYPRQAYANPNSLPPSRGDESVASTTRAATPSLRFPGAAPASTARPHTATASIRQSLKSRLSVDAFPTSMKIFSRRQVMPPTQHGQDESRIKSKSRKPHPTKSKSRNWWDGLVEQEEESEAEDDHDLTYVTPTNSEFPSGAGIPLSPGPSEIQFQVQGNHTSMYTVRKMHSAHEMASNKSNKSATVLRTPRPHTAMSRTSRKSSRLASIDLGETSMLSTSSSSEGESEAEAESSDDMAHHELRKSIAVSELGDIHIGQAEALRVNPVRRALDVTAQERRPSVASVSSNPTTADSSSIKSATGPAYLSVPHPTSRSRKSGHIRQPSSIPEDSDTSSQVASPISPRESMRSFSAPQGEHRKLMEVSAEEEALLELMRQKRADKAALRDSGLASIKTSSTRSGRPFSNLSASSSILDSFPLSRSQRSSLMASRVSTQPTPLENSSSSKELKDISSRGRKRQSNATTATSASYHSIQSRLESPSRTKYAFTPHLSLASLDSLGPRSPSLDGRSVSTPEPLESPRTPLTRRGSADVMIKTVPSTLR